MELGHAQHLYRVGRNVCGRQRKGNGPKVQSRNERPRGSSRPRWASPAAIRRFTAGLAAPPALRSVIPAMTGEPIWSIHTSHLSLDSLTRSASRSSDLDDVQVGATPMGGPVSEHVSRHSRQPIASAGRPGLFSVTRMKTGEDRICDAIWREQQQRDQSCIKETGRGTTRHAGIR